MKMRFRTLVFCCAFAICGYSGNSALAEVCFVVGGCDTGSSSNKNVDDCGDLGFHSTVACVGVVKQETCTSNGKTYYKCGCPPEYNLSSAEKSKLSTSLYDFDSTKDNITGEMCYKATCKAKFKYPATKTVSVKKTLLFDYTKTITDGAEESVDITGSGTECDGKYDDYACSTTGWNKNRNYSNSDLLYVAQYKLEDGTAVSCYHRFDCSGITGGGYLEDSNYDSGGWKANTTKTSVFSQSNGVSYASTKCYKKVAKTCADYGYNNTATCSNANDVAAQTLQTFKLGDADQHCYQCDDCSSYYASKDACVAQLAVMANDKKPAYCKRGPGSCSGRWELIETTGSCPINFNKVSSVEEKYLPRDLFASAVDIFKAVFGVNDAMAQDVEPCHWDACGICLTFDGQVCGRCSSHDKPQTIKADCDGGGSGGPGAWTGCVLTSTEAADTSRFYSCERCSNGKYTCYYAGHDCTNSENYHYLWKDGQDGHKVCMYCFFGTLSKVTTNGHEDDTLCQAENPITCAEKYGVGYYDTESACNNYIANNSTSVSDEKNYLKCIPNGAIEMVHMCYKPAEASCPSGSYGTPPQENVFTYTTYSSAYPRCYKPNGCVAPWTADSSAVAAESKTEGSMTCYKGGCTAVEANGKVYCQQCQCLTSCPDGFCVDADNGCKRKLKCNDIKNIVLSFNYTSGGKGYHRSCTFVSVKGENNEGFAERTSSYSLGSNYSNVDTLYTTMWGLKKAYTKIINDKAYFQLGAEGERCAANLESGTCQVTALSGGSGTSDLATIVIEMGSCGSTTHCSGTGGNGQSYAYTPMKVSVDGTDKYCLSNDGTTTCSDMPHGVYTVTYDYGNGACDSNNSPCYQCSSSTFKRPKGVMYNGSTRTNGYQFNITSGGTYTFRAQCGQ